MQNDQYIYGLFDPISNELRYIGKTNNIEIRFNTHCNSLRTKTHKNNWVKSLKNKNLKPKIEIIDTGTEQSINELEIFYISYFKFIGCDLTNHTSGGEGTTGRKISEKTRNKMSLSAKKRFEKYPELRQASANAVRKTALTMKRDDTYRNKCKNSSKKRKVICLNNCKYSESLMEASRTYNISNGSLSDVLNMKTISIKGLFFKWALDKEPSNLVDWCLFELNKIKEYKTYKDKKIYQYKKIFCNENSKTFDSIKEAALQLKLNYTYLVGNIKKNKPTKGFTFKYVK